jgi:2-aminoadipate transaminase
MKIEDDHRGAGQPDGAGRTRRTAAHELERYSSLFARRTQMMRSSAMRDLMAVTARPDVISLAGGLPDTTTFAPEALSELMHDLAMRDSAMALQYGPTDGHVEARDCVVEVMAAEDMRVEADDVLITTGGQQVIDLVCKTLIDPGDVIVAEAPTYPGAVPTFCSYQADVVQIDMDNDGMRMDLLEQALDALGAEGRAPKFIYTIPSFQNPAGVTMSLERRRRLVALAAERELLVLEDNPYGLLRFEGAPQPTLRSLDGGAFVIYLGTFSKILSPGLRLGWTVAPRPVLEKMNLGKQAVDLCSSSFTQKFVGQYFRDGRWREYVDSQIAVYRDRRDVMLEALAEHFPAEATWTRPEGGLFVWATLPPYIDTTDLLARALQDNVAFVPGRAAYLDERGGSEMRLNFSGVGDDEIREGIRRIGKVVREQVDLYATIAGGDAAPAAGTATRPRSAPVQAHEGARVVPLPRRRAGGR